MSIKKRAWEPDAYQSTDAFMRIWDLNIYEMFRILSKETWQISRGKKIHATKELITLIFTQAELWLRKLSLMLARGIVSTKGNCKP